MRLARRQPLHARARALPRGDPNGELQYELNGFSSEIFTAKLTAVGESLLKSIPHDQIEEIGLRLRLGRAERRGVKLRFSRGFKTFRSHGSTSGPESTPRQKGT